MSLLTNWCVVSALLALGVRSDNDTVAEAQDQCSLEPGQQWTCLLQEWALSDTGENHRHGRIMALPPSSGYYVTNRIDRLPPPPYPPHNHPPYPPMTSLHPPTPGPNSLLTGEMPSMTGEHYSNAGLHSSPTGQHSSNTGTHSSHTGTHSSNTGTHSSHTETHSSLNGPHAAVSEPHSPHGPVSYDEWQMSPPPPPDGKIVNRPPNPYKDKFKPSPQYQPPPYQQIPLHPPSQSQYPSSQSQYPSSQSQYPSSQSQYPSSQSQYPSSQSQYPSSQSQYPSSQSQQHPSSQSQYPPSNQFSDRIGEAAPTAKPPQKPNNQKQVSETDLYLLSAIEKLVYRVDLMEKRLRKVEESLHYVIVGADKKPEPCVANFSRVGDVCYHISEDPVDWKTANLWCRKLRANLVELDSENERRTLVAAMMADKRIRGMDIWTGGLNPGLLWIWSHSARPVVNATTSGNTTTSGITIVGEGRCLAMVYDPTRNHYVYRGQDCALRHRFICEKEEDKAKLSNEIERVARSMKGFSGGVRKARLLLGDQGHYNFNEQETVQY